MNKLEKIINELCPNDVEYNEVVSLQIKQKEELGKAIKKVKCGLLKLKKKDLLLALIEESIAKFYTYEKSLIRRKMERASAPRIFYYMQELLKYDNRFASLSFYDLDNEYDRDGYNRKAEELSERGKRPDIILHIREDNPKKDNVLILEIKYENREILYENDIEKLEYFTSKKKYCYFLGVLIILGQEKAQYLYFQKGDKLKKKEDIRNV